MRSMLFLAILCMTGIPVISHAAAHLADSNGNNQHGADPTVDQQQDAQQEEGDEGAQEEAVADDQDADDQDDDDQDDDDQDDDGEDADDQDADDQDADDQDADGEDDDGEDDDGEDADGEDDDGEDAEAAETSEEAEDESEQPAKKTKDDPKKVKLRCYFVSKHEERTILRPLEWKSFPITSVVEHGAEVQRGDTVISFDSRQLDTTIEDLENEIAQAKISLLQAVNNLEVLRRSNEIGLEAAERAERIAVENLKRFLIQDRRDRKQALDFSVKSAENRLAYQQEEYNQLKRMYEADDLTEETEEIILRRTRASVESAEYSLDRYQKSRDHGLEVDLPRGEEDLEEKLRKATLALERTRLSNPAKEEQETLALEKLRLGFERKERKLQRLQEDRRLMEISAPMSGVVYFGDHNRGKWSAATQMAALLRVGAAAKLNQPLLTIVQNDDLYLQGTVSEKDLAVVTVGANGVGNPTAFRDSKLAIRVDAVSLVPVSDGQFKVEASIGAIPDDVTFTPGMTCQVVFDVTPKPNGE